MIPTLTDNPQFWILNAPFFALLLLLSICSLSLIIEKLLLLKSWRWHNHKLPEQIRLLLKDGQLKELGLLLETEYGPEAILLRKSFYFIKHDTFSLYTPQVEASEARTWFEIIAPPTDNQIHRLEQWLEIGIEELGQRLEKHCSLFHLIANVSTLLGLLGTVTGMIYAFQNGALEQNTQLAQGISQALVTTAGGLIVAIPAIIGQQLFLNSSAQRVATLEQIGHDILLFMHQNRALEQQTQIPSQILSSANVLPAKQIPKHATPTHSVQYSTINGNPDQFRGSHNFQENFPKPNKIEEEMRVPSSSALSEKQTPIQKQEINQNAQQAPIISDQQEEKIENAILKDKEQAEQIKLATEQLAVAQIFQTPTPNTSLKSNQNPSPKNDQLKPMPEYKSNQPIVIPMTIPMVEGKNSNFNFDGSKNQEDSLNPENQVSNPPLKEILEAITEEELREKPEEQENFNQLKQVQTKAQKTQTPENQVSTSIITNPAPKQQKSEQIRREINGIASNSETVSLLTSPNSKDNIFATRLAELQLERERSRIRQLEKMRSSIGQISASLESIKQSSNTANIPKNANDGPNMEQTNVEEYSQIGLEEDDSKNPKPLKSPETTLETEKQQLFSKLPQQNSILPTKMQYNDEPLKSGNDA